MDFGDDVGGDSVSDGINSPIVSLCDSSIFKGGFRVPAPVDGPTTTFLEFRNQSEKWVVFRLKCTHPNHFTVKPRSIGLISPKESQELRFTLLTNYDSHAKYQLLIETTFMSLQRIQGPVGKREISAIWNEANKNNITTTRFPIFICNADSKPPPKLNVFFDEAPVKTPAATKENPWVSTKAPTATKENQKPQRSNIFMAILRNEKIFSNGLVLLLLLCHSVFMYFSCVMVYRSFL